MANSKHKEPSIMITIRENEHKFDDKDVDSNALLWRHNGRNGVSDHQPHD